MLVELTEDNLKDQLQLHPNAVVMYSAGWCGNCRLIKPKFKRMSAEQEALSFFIVDAEKFPESRKLAQVNNLPTFASFKDGHLLTQVQTNKEDVIKQLTHEITGH